ncbi:exosome complex component Csl4p [Diutina catenulata]
MKVVPGQFITPQYKQLEDSVTKYTPGNGATVTTVMRQGTAIPMITASKLGEVEYKGDVVSVVNPTNTKAHVLPKEGDVVLVRITRTSIKQAWCELVSTNDCVNVISDAGLGANGMIAHGSVPPGAGAQNLSSIQAVASSAAFGATTRDIGESYRGVIRVQDVRSTDRDRVKMVESFRPGDIVRATIISLGDGNHYYLSTAANDWGVIFARSRGGAGSQMYPVDWQHMMDARGEVELRKVAKPFTA